MQPNLGDVWGALGHCYLMNDELKEAYAAYQRALYSSQAAKVPYLFLLGRGSNPLSRPGFMI